MHSKTTRAALAALLTASLAGGLTACGSDDQNTSSSNTSMMHSTTAGTSATAADVDAAFVRQMIPHHQMAVVMAESAKRSATHAQIKTLATAIIAAQQKEIAQMKAIAKANGVDRSGATSMMNGDARTMGLAMSAMGMSMNTADLDGASNYDRAFIDMMIPHHQGAIAMAKVELAKGSDAELKTLARGIVAAQEKEIAEMRAWRKAWFGSSGVDATTGTGHMDHGDMPGM